MRWQPTEPVCSECGFTWAIPVEQAIAIVADLPTKAASALDPATARREPGPGVWSPGAYVWHLVDALSIGTERLWTIADDPASGLRCWDENELARVRGYGQLSPTVGLRALRSAAVRWLDAARAADPRAGTVHDGDGEMTAADVVRRNAHEAHHHLLDIVRGSAQPGPSVEGGTGGRR